MVLSLLQPMDIPDLRPETVPETISGLNHVEKEEGLTQKLLRLDALNRKENDIMDPKKKRGFGENSAPLDRLSGGGMEAHKTSKVSEASRRKPSPPIDRIGTGHLPGNKG
uniref:Osteocrin n=1 Tax=Knipowitschia caucasica TaxID=637954 RepID=A0AAV2J850_KNICA